MGYADAFPVVRLTPAESRPSPSPPPGPPCAPRRHTPGRDHGQHPGQRQPAQHRGPRKAAANSPGASVRHVTALPNSCLWSDTRGSGQSVHTTATPPLVNAVGSLPPLIEVCADAEFEDRAVANGLPGPDGEMR